VILHPTAFQIDRFYRSDDGTMYELPQMLKRWNLGEKGVPVVESSGPSILGSGYFLVTGEIPRVTDFERGLPGSVMVVDGNEVPDTVPDDQAIVVDVEGRGLVIVSGCAHAGIVNTIYYARALTGGRPVHAVVGGFHLAGEPFRAALLPTLEAIRVEKPSLVAPMHCTGVKAKDMFRREMSGVNEESAVGTRFQLPR
jgi:7,8-dihydropterin-6-yl-methyl-4-(beta-D-ribofuranosyl)aminobenzene 5'-phosphate synthase